jgi:hypothetical protein
VEPALRHIFRCATYPQLCGAPHNCGNGNWEGCHNCLLAWPFFCSAPAEHSSRPLDPKAGARSGRQGWPAPQPLHLLGVCRPSLTAVSTTAHWRGTATQDHNQARSPSIRVLASRSKYVILLTRRNAESGQAVCDSASAANSVCFNCIRFDLRKNAWFRARPPERGVGTSVILSALARRTSSVRTSLRGEQSSTTLREISWVAAPPRLSRRSPKSG